MPIIESHKPGEFCWVELATTDQDGAKAFYKGLFGWDTADMPMGPGETYTMLRVDGHDAAALYKLRAEQTAQGVPSHWMLYVAVTSADDAAAKAKQLGANVIVQPFDVFDFGRMAVFQDPTGATLCVWEAKRHVGTTIEGEVNTFGWGELATRDTAKATIFYTQLFPWTAKPDPKHPYTEWVLDGKSFGGMLQMDEKWGPAPPYWSPYFRVADCAASVAKAGQLGGQVMMPPTEIENVGRFAVLRDPQGAVFSIIELK